VFPADDLPVADTNMGPGSLTLFLGSELKFEPEEIIPLLNAFGGK